ncbi:hypothetical protein SAMN05660284_02611, partial [Formivibrio citricus]
EKHSKAREFGEHCLRPQAELRSRRVLRASQGTLQGRRSGLA